MFADFQVLHGVSEGAQREGYDRISIIDAIYYTSALTEVSLDSSEKPIGNTARVVFLPYAGHSPLIEQASRRSDLVAVVIG